MIDKIIERLEKQFNKYGNGEYYKGFERATQQAIDIVKQVAEEGGWIKCSDRLPGMTRDYGMISDKVLLTNGSEVVFGWRRNNEWVTPDMIPFERQELIKAWQPLPKPFKESD